MKTLLGDLRYSFRLLARGPGFAAVAVLTLALAIGVNTAIFSLVRSVLLSPLPYREPERLVTLYSRFPKLGFDHFWISPPEYLELRQRLHGLADLGAYSLAGMNLTGGDKPQRVNVAIATSTLFSTLGVSPELGHFYSPAEDLPGTELVAVLGHGLWRRTFAGDPEVVGKAVSIDGVQRKIIGVMPPQFELGGEPVDLWLPLALGPIVPAERGRHYLNLVGRLAPGASLPATRAELSQLVLHWHDSLPDAHTPSPDEHPLVVDSLLDSQVREVRPALLLLWGAVGLVLLIACANIANLLLVRAQVRQLEMAVRTALGAGSGRLLRQLVIESLVLSLLGGALGLLVAYLGVRGIVAINPQSIPRLETTRLDGWGLLFTVLVSLTTSLIFSLAPALQTRTSAFLESLKGSGTRTTRGTTGRRFQRRLVVAEIAFATALVTGGGLLIRSFWALQQVDPGFRPHGVLSFQINLPRTSYPDAPQRATFFREALRRLSALPGVEAAAVMTGRPPKREVDAVSLRFESLPFGRNEGPPRSCEFLQVVSQHFFQTLKVPLVAGRFFTAADSPTSGPVVVINQTMAKVFWPGRDAIGQRIRWSPEGSPWMTVIGIARDVKQSGLDRKAGTEVYALVDQVPATIGHAPASMYFVLRARESPGSLSNSARQQISALDPALPIAKVETLDQVVYDTISAPRFVTFLVLVFASVALVLAAVGTYGVLANLVEQRSQEIGLRMALGAEMKTVLTMVLAEGARLVLVGLVLGQVLALSFGRLLASLLFGVSAADPLTFLAVALLLALVALLASYLPARRAARVDPVTSLRGT